MQTILARHPEIAIVILTEREDSESLTNAFIFGARGYLLKNTSKQKLIASLRAVMRGEPALTRAMVGKVLAVLARVGKMIHEQPPESSLLTYREEQVLKHLANARSNREVADTLGISENTVRVHVRNILSKLQLRSRQEAGDYARRMGITFTIQTITRSTSP
jgi:DNA-binding NarL/FixJ family response regulator